MARVLSVAGRDLSALHCQPPHYWLQGETRRKMASKMSPKWPGMKKQMKCSNSQACHSEEHQGPFASINYATKELFQHLPHQAQVGNDYYSWDGRDCLCLESSPMMARAGVEGVGCGDQYPGQFVIHWGTLIRRLGLAGGGAENRGVRKGTVAWDTLHLSLLRWCLP